MQRTAARARRSDRTISLGNCTVTWYALARTRSFSRAKGLNLNFHMHDEAVAASSAPCDTARRYLPYESLELYGPTKKIRYIPDLDI